MTATAILTIFFIIIDRGIASADMVNPSVPLMLSIPVTLFLILALILYWTLKVIMRLRTNPYTTDNTHIEKSPKASEKIVTYTDSSKPEKSFIEILWDYCSSLFCILIVLLALAFVEIHCDSRSVRVKPHLIVRNDCSMLTDAIRKYNYLESAKVKDRYMSELKGKYIQNIDTLKDPWGNPYENDYKRGILYSKGPDGKHRAYSDGGNALSPENQDDITASYIGTLTLSGASIEVNPEDGDYRAATNTVELAKCYDRIHLYFNKEVSIPASADLGKAVPASAWLLRMAEDKDPADDKIFMYYIGADRSAKTITAPCDLSKATSRMTVTTIDKLTSMLPDAGIAYGSDSTEIVIKYAAGFTCVNPEKKLLIPSIHYINITGAENNKNKLWFEPDLGLDQTGATPAHTEGAKRADLQLPLEVYQKVK